MAHREYSLWMRCDRKPSDHLPHGGIIVESKLAGKGDVPFWTIRRSGKCTLTPVFEMSYWCENSRISCAPYEGRLAAQRPT